MLRMLTILNRRRKRLWVVLQDVILQVTISAQLGSTQTQQ